MGWSRPILRRHSAEQSSGRFYRTLQSPNHASAPMPPKRTTVLLAELRESFHMAMGALAAHKLRSALTLLGVLVGVFSIIVVMTAMRVMKSDIEKEISRLGSQTFMVRKW